LVRNYQLFLRFRPIHSKVGVTDRLLQGNGSRSLNNRRYTEMTAKATATRAKGTKKKITMSDDFAIKTIKTP